MYIFVDVITKHFQMIQFIKPIVFFDLETTGTDVNKDRIVQIACIKIFPDGTREEKDYLINPGMPIPAEATAIHGKTDEMVKDAPLFKQLAKGIFAYMFECDLGGYNSDRFDIPMLIAEFLRCDIIFPTWPLNTVDVLKNEYRKVSNKLVDVYFRRTGKDLSDAHDALADVRATIEVFEDQCRSEEEPITVKHLEDIIHDGKLRFDFSGRCYLKEEILYWNSGKNKDKPIFDDIPYLEFMLNAKPPYELPAETKNLLIDVLNKRKLQR